MRSFSVESRQFAHKERPLRRSSYFDILPVVSKMPKIIWNDNLLLALSDVDDTLAETYTRAESGIINEINSFLRDGNKLFMVTGGSLARIKRDITQYIDPILRQNILVSHCSGAEVWGSLIRERYAKNHSIVSTRILLTPK